MNYKFPEPIVMISGFKAGTWLLRKIISGLTQLDVYEPPLIAGENKYYNADQLHFVDKHFYSWHLVPTREVIDKLNAHNAKTIFLIRNIYDLAVSIYYHFFNNIDEDIGRGAGKHHFLKQFSFAEGLSLIITGFDEDGTRWTGMADPLRQYNEIFKAHGQCDSIIINYDHLVDKKKEILIQLTKHLDISTPASTIENLINETSFSAMKAAAGGENMGFSHFREGKAATNRQQLANFHIIQLRQMIKLCVPDLYHNAERVQMTEIISYST